MSRSRLSNHVEAARFSLQAIAAAAASGFHRCTGAASQSLQPLQRRSRARCRNAGCQMALISPEKAAHREDG
jgi:hypothetical protein